MSWLLSTQLEQDSIRKATVLFHGVFYNNNIIDAIASSHVSNNNIQILHLVKNISKSNLPGPRSNAAI